MRPPQIIPVEELGKAALLFDAVGRWAQVDPFVLHGPPQALDEDVVVAAPASVHADLDPMIPQHLGALLAGERRPLTGMDDVGLAAPDAGLATRSDPAPRRDDGALRAAWAVEGARGEEPFERLQKLEFLGSFGPRPVIKAAAHNPEQRALPAYGQPRFRRDHRPPLSTREMAGCPARKSHSTCSCPIFRCRSSITFCASAAAGALLPRANSSPARFTSSCFQLLIIVGLIPNSADSSARVFFPDSDAIATRALNSALC